ncbi:cytochrome c family protein [Rhodobacterales bacterium HTCC2150]|nr:cytochrome c family protein [Rhodobacterales bacterium HTCC2150] [Rhodobacteraceae bacterium HTCC2150]
MRRFLSIAVCVVATIFGSFGFAEADIDRGKKVFRKCKACHTIGEGATNKTGPILTGIMGVPAGVVEGFQYSSELRAAAEIGLVWDDASLTEFLRKPRKFIPGTKMSFSGLRKDQDISNLIDFLRSVE